MSRDRSVDCVRAWKDDRTRTKCLGSLCRDCAEAFGGEWPAGHVATMYQGTCCVCREKASLAAPSDWQLGRDGVKRKIHWTEWD